MAWLCCTVVPQRECLWLRWGLLALQTSKIFSCVAWGGAVVCLVYLHCNSVFMIQCFVTLQPKPHLHYSLQFSIDKSCSWWAGDAICLVTEALSVQGWVIIHILGVISIHVHHYVLCLLCSLVKGCMAMTYLDAMYSLSLSLSFPLSLLVRVCVCVKDSHINFYYEYKMRLLRTVLLSGVCCAALWCCTPSCEDSAGRYVNIKAFVPKHLKLCIYLKAQSVIHS